MLSDSEKRVLVFIIVGSVTGFFHHNPEEKPERLISFPISINSATEEELTLLPGIGDVIAKRILEYRERNKGFKTKDEIIKVKGIGKVKFEKMKEKICVEKKNEVEN
jgi:competence ComEA-like helix-hairpin-helix protein